MGIASRSGLSIATPGVRLNPSHPLAQGLVFLGGQSQDLGPGGGMVGGAIYWRQQMPTRIGAGVGFSANHNQNGLWYPFPALMASITTEYTVVTWLQLYNSIVGSAILSIPYQSGSSPARSFYLAEYTAADLFIDSRQAGGNNRNTGSGSVLTFGGELIQIAITRRGTAMSWYRNGVKTASDTYGTTNPIEWGSFQPVCLLTESSTAPGWTHQGIVPQALISARAWTPAEVRQNFEEPWDFLAQRAVRSYSIPSTTVLLGTVDATLAITATGNGSLGISGVAASTLASSVGNASGTVGILGTASPVLPPVALSATASVGAVGTAVVVLGTVVASAQGQLRLTGIGSAQVSARAEAVGKVASIGSGAGQLPPIAGTAIGFAATGNTGVASIMLPPIAATVVGKVGILGSLAVATPQCAVIASGTIANRGFASSSLPWLSMSALGKVGLLGEAAPRLPLVTMSAYGQIGDSSTTVPARRVLRVLAEDRSLRVAREDRSVRLQ